MSVMRTLESTGLARGFSGRAASSYLALAGLLVPLFSCAGRDTTHVTGLWLDEGGGGSGPVAEVAEPSGSVDRMPDTGVQDPGEQQLSADPPAAVVPPAAVPVAFDAGTDAGTPEAGPRGIPYPADWCSLVGGDDFDQRYSVAAATTDMYFTALLLDCHLSALVALEDPELFGFAEYLFEYTNALFGCPPLFAEPPGGISVFGLAITDVAGVAPPPYGVEEAELLVQAFMESLSAMVALGAREEQALFEYLTELGRERAAPLVTLGLSTCEIPEGG